MVSMLDCIKRVPERMRWMTDHRGKVFQPLDERFGDRVAQWDELVLMGCGTSKTAAVTARFPAQRLAGIRVTPVLPGKFLHEQVVRNPGALYVFVSQTGTSALTRGALALAHRLGCSTLAVSEASITPMAREADAFLVWAAVRKNAPCARSATVPLCLFWFCLACGWAGGSIRYPNRQSWIS